MNPISKIGETTPITFDFTDEGVGPLPGMWETFVITTNGAVVSGAPEPDPDAYFSVQGGLGWWRYRRLPATANPFEEHGYAASPAGLLVSPNAELSVALVSPLRLLAALLDGQSQDAFVFDVTLAMRASDDVSRYVGARLRTSWAGGVWTAPVLEAVRADVLAPPGVLATAIFPPTNEPQDVWQNNPLHALTVRVVDGLLTVSMDGTVVATAAVDPTNGATKPVLFVRVYATRGLLTTSLPCVAGLSLRSLRQLSRLGAAPAIPGADELEAPQLPTLQLPLDELTADGYFKRTGGRTFECIREVQTDVEGTQRLWEPGNVVRILDEFAPGLMSVVVDLAVLRGRSGGV